ncbi:hypothetical protein [Streptomyces mirabilis]|uniref:hypothetical protein n=1 Tax=Streptomyces mirabilis TaxID=68239 RepID=UPI0033B75996
MDPDRGDLWLYENDPAHRQTTRETLAAWVDSVAEFARLRGIPAVLGEGVVGCTPPLTRFEEDAVGKDIAEFVVDSCLAAGFQGVVLTSNAAPRHLMWHTRHVTDVAVATMILARLKETDDGQWKLSWTNVGRPPPPDRPRRPGHLPHRPPRHSPGHPEPAGPAPTPPPCCRLLLYTDLLIKGPCRTSTGVCTNSAGTPTPLAHRLWTSFTDQLLRRARPAANDDGLLALRGPTLT